MERVDLEHGLVADGLRWRRPSKTHLESDEQQDAAGADRESIDAASA
jgi:hypothetical protein